MTDSINKNDIYVVNGVAVESQTSKAWLVSLLCDLKGEPTTSQVWVPKSQTTVTEDRLVLKGWLLLKKIEELSPNALALAVTRYEDSYSSTCSEENRLAEEGEDDEFDWRDLGDDIY